MELFSYVAPSNISNLFLVLNERRFLFSCANVTLNETLIEHSMPISMPLSLRDHMKRANVISIINGKQNKLIVSHSTPSFIFHE